MEIFKDENGNTIGIMDGSWGNGKYHRPLDSIPQDYNVEQKEIDFDLWASCWDKLLESSKPKNKFKLYLKLIWIKIKKMFVKLKDMAT